MKRTAALLLSMILVIVLAAGCGNNKGSDNQQGAGNEGAYKNGIYYAEGDYDAKSGWKEVVAITVEKGKITKVNWNGLHKDGGMDKKFASESGAYGLVAKGGAQAEWHEQATKAEQYLIDKQDPNAIKYNAEDGKTDAISGVSIHVNGLVELATKALEAGPVQSGPYKDGTYHAQAADFDAKSGWKETVDLTVLNGKIFAARWNGVHKDGGTDKVTRSKDGEYGMKAGGASSEWHEQSLAAEKFLLEKQDPKAITVSDDGKTDAITGVSIHVNGFQSLAQQALDQAK